MKEILGYSQETASHAESSSDCKNPQAPDLCYSGSDSIFSKKPYIQPFNLLVSREADDLESKHEDSENPFARN